MDAKCHRRITERCWALRGTLEAKVNEKNGFSAGDLRSVLVGTQSPDVASKDALHMGVLKCCLHAGGVGNVNKQMEEVMEESRAEETRNEKMF